MLHCEYDEYITVGFTHALKVYLSLAFSTANNNQLTGKSNKIEIAKTLIL